MAKSKATANAVGIMPMDERDWEAESDARHMMESEKIKADPERLKKAQAAAKKMQGEKQDEAGALQKVAEYDMGFKQGGKRG